MNSAFYIYTVTSNKPLDLTIGAGNMPHIYHNSNGGNLTKRDIQLNSTSNGAASSVNLKISMELTERIESNV